MASKSQAGDRHKSNPQTVRLPDADRAWYAEAAARLGITPHALMVRALSDYRMHHDPAWAPPPKPEPAEA